MKIRAKAPLRLGLAGGGTDLSPYCDQYGGCVLNATINMYANCTLETINEERVIFDAVDIEKYFEEKALPYYEANDDLKLHKGVYNRIVKDYNDGKPLNIRLTTYCDAPMGSGLGSSSALVVVMLKAYIELLQIPLGEYDVAKLAFDIERCDLGLSGGKQDQYAATFGGFNFMQFYAGDRVIVNPLRIRDWMINELESSMILLYTGKSRESSHIIDEQIKGTVQKHQDSIQAMHFLKESAIRMKEALLKGDIKGIASELTISWEAKKKTASVISNPLIEKIYDEAMSAGAIAGKISGAGGGGFMMFIVDPEKKINVIRALAQHDVNQIKEVTFVDKGTKSWYLL